MRKRTRRQNSLFPEVCTLRLVGIHKERRQREGYTPQRRLETIDQWLDKKGPVFILQEVRYSIRTNEALRCFEVVVVVVVEGNSRRQAVSPTGRQQAVSASLYGQSRKASLKVPSQTGNLMNLCTLRPGSTPVTLGVRLPPPGGSRAKNKSL